jgi:hypothetical protein
MFRSPSITLLLLCILTAGCDMPPSEIIDGELSVDTETEEDTGSEIDTGTDTGSETEVETDSDPEIPGDGQCLQAMICIAVKGAGSTLECFGELDEDDAEAASALALCMVGNCPDALTDVLELAICFLGECSEEAVDCIGYSLF